MSDRVRADEAAELWEAVLADLEYSLAPGVFSAWLADSRGLSVDHDMLFVGVKSAHAVEYLTARVRGRIEPVLVRVLQGRQAPLLRLVFVEDEPDTAEARANSADLQEPAPSVAEMWVELVHFDPRDRGHVQASNYAVRFWLPYLGNGPFLTWVVLKSFAYGARAGDGQWPAIPTLADILGVDRQRLTGRERRGKWQQGWLEALEEARVIWYERRGHSRYVYRVVDRLPLLTADQVRQLPRSCQEAHAAWLQRAGLDVQQWRQLSLPTLVDG